MIKNFFSIFTTIFVIVFCLFSCQKKSDENSGENPEGGWDSLKTYFIDRIFYADTIYVSYSNRTPLYYYKYGDRIELMMVISGEPLSDSETEEIRYELGDYGVEKIYNGSLTGPIHVFINDFDGINVTSDTQFNDYAPGESLNDILEIQASSALPVIQDKTRVDPYGFVKPVSSFSSPDMYLTSNYFSLWFTQSPEIKEHKLTVSLMEGDRVLTTTKHVLFP